MIVKVTNISWDITDMDEEDSTNLPEEMTVEIPDDLSRNDILEKTKERIRSLSGYDPFDFDIDV